MNQVGRLREPYFYLSMFSQNRIYHRLLLYFLLTRLMLYFFAYIKDYQYAVSCGYIVPYEGIYRNPVSLDSNNKKI